MSKYLVKTGEFAKLCGTTRNTLLHYDHLGLLKPAKVEPNGYRYYGTDQYVRFITIRALVDSGFPLSEIAEVLDRNDAGYIAQAVQHQLAAVNARMRELAHAERMLKEIARQARRIADAHTDPVIVERGPAELLVVSAEGTYLDEAASLHEGAGRDLAALSVLARISPEAEMAPFCAAVDPVPVARGQVSYLTTYYLLPEHSHVPMGAETETMPGGRYALVDHDGTWNQIVPTYQRLLAFVGAQGATLAGPLYELEKLRLLEVDNSGKTPYPCTLLAPLG